ncbi:MAG: hypothetical protein QW255_04610 [Candidatus Bilamarchaeaceae archaeon]
MSTTIDELRYSGVTRVAGASEQYALDVRNIAGLNRAAVESISTFSQMQINTYSIPANTWTIIFDGYNISNPCGLLIGNPSSTVDVFINTVGSGNNGILIPPRTTIYFAYIGSQKIYAFSESSVNISVTQLGV